MKTCACGLPVDSRYGILCRSCLHKARSNAGKTQRQKTGNRKSIYAQKKKLTMAKCPACQIMHPIVADYEEGKVPRIYCPKHRLRQEISEIHPGV
jgi:hypothetical protein